jgi:hypothetical protein
MSHTAIQCIYSHIEKQKIYKMKEKETYILQNNPQVISLKQSQANEI